MNTPAADAKRITADQRQELIKWALQAAVGLVGYGLVIFISAGTLQWVWGWILLGVLAVFLAAHPLLVARKHADLLVERRKGTRAKGVKRWDKWITGAAGALMLLSWVVAGLEFRFEWGQTVPLLLHFAGLLVMIVGYGLFLWAMASNRFFSEGVRIQEERGHAVATGGPYRIVRHPGYTGAILAQLSTPFLLGSVWALAPSLLLAALFVLRTALEDETLMNELPGYPVYAQRIRYRLVPRVW